MFEINFELPGEEARDGVPGQVVDPSFGPQLGHDGVDEGEPGAGLTPRRKVRRVRVPGDLAAHGVA